MVLNLFQNLDKKEFEKSKKIISAWEKILSKIKKKNEDGKTIDYGAFLQAHTELVDLKNGIVFIEADHSGFLQILQLYSSFIKKSLQKEMPDLKINSISFKIKRDGEEKSERNFTKDVLENIPNEESVQEKIVEKRKNLSENLENYKKLPEEIQKKFEKMKEYLLTKNEKE